MLCGAVRCCVELYGAVWSCMVLCRAAWCVEVQYVEVQYVEVCGAVFQYIIHCQQSIAQVTVCTLLPLKSTGWVKG